MAVWIRFFIRLFRMCYSWRVISCCHWKLCRIAVFHFSFPAMRQNLPIGSVSLHAWSVPQRQGDTYLFTLQSRTITSRILAHRLSLVCSSVISFRHIGTIDLVSEWLQRLCRCWSLWASLLPPCLVRFYIFENHWSLLAFSHFSILNTHSTSFIYLFI